MSKIKTHSQTFSTEEMMNILSQRKTQMRIPKTLLKSVKVGDLFFAKEHWLPDPPNDNSWPYHAFYDGRNMNFNELPERFKTPQSCIYKSKNPYYNLKWLPPSKMPQWAAQVWLEVTYVAEGTIQNITEAECIAEGQRGGHRSILGYHYNATPREHYEDVCKKRKINFEENPEVWIIHFQARPATE